MRVRVPCLPFLPDNKCNGKKRMGLICLLSSTPCLRNSPLFVHHGARKGGEQGEERGVVAGGRGFPRAGVQGQSVVLVSLGDVRQ